MRFKIVVFSAIFTLLSGAALGAEYSLKPSISVSEEYNDNIFENRGKGTGEFITRLLPGLSMGYRTPFWDWEADYSLDYRNYARGNKGDEITHQVRGKGSIRLIDNFLFLDLSDTFKRVSLDYIRDYSTESLFLNQADQNTFTVSPYMFFRPTPQMTVKTGYQYINTAYFGSSGGTAVDREVHGAFITATYELNQKCVLTAGFDYSHEKTVLDINHDRLTPSVGIRYNYSDRSFASANFGYSWFLYEDGHSFDSPYWNAGITHAFDFLTASVNSGVSYNTDPLGVSTEERHVVIRLDKTLERGTIGLSANYSELQNNDTGEGMQNKFGVGGGVSYELLDKITGRLDVSGDKYNDDGNSGTIGLSGYPYRLSVGTGISWTLKDTLTASLNYNYITYRNSVDSAANDTEINRVIVEIRKMF